jgi:succinate dehydrogenase flavin-adding protein (antitoxin of CptAB toxin-antitoxin module)
MFSKNGKVDMDKINAAKKGLSREDTELFNHLMNNKEERERLFNSPEVQKIVEMMKKGKP